MDGLILLSKKRTFKAAAIPGSLYFSREKLSPGKNVYQIRQLPFAGSSAPSVWRFHVFNCFCQSCTVYL
jgi:hypothetical protein